MAESNIVNLSSVKEVVANSRHLSIMVSDPYQYNYQPNWRSLELRVSCKKLKTFSMRISETHDMYSRHTICLDGNAKRLGGWLTMRLGERNYHYWKLEGKDTTTEGVIEFIQELDQALDWIYSK